jgi:hypothetical protein
MSERIHLRSLKLGRTFCRRPPSIQYAATATLRLVGVDGSTRLSPNTGGRGRSAIHDVLLSTQYDG